MSTWKKRVLISMAFLLPLIRPAYSDLKENCDLTIKAVQKQHPEAKTYDDLFFDSKKDIDDCVKIHGKKSLTPFALTFRPSLSKNIPLAGYTEETFTAEQIAGNLPKIASRLIAGTKVEIPQSVQARGSAIKEIEDLRTHIIRSNGDLILAMNKKEAENFVDDQVRKSQFEDEDAYRGEDVSEFDVICDELGHGKVKEVKLSKNIIPANTDRAKKMIKISSSTNYTNTALNSFSLDFDTPNDIHYKSLQINKDEELEFGYRFIEQITCARLSETATDAEKDEYENIEQDIFVAGSKIKSAVTYTSDPSYVKENGQVDTSRDRSPAYVAGPESRGGVNKLLEEINNLSQQR